MAVEYYQVLVVQSLVVVLLSASLYVYRRSHMNRLPLTHVARPAFENIFCPLWRTWRHRLAPCSHPYLSRATCPFDGDVPMMFVWHSQISILRAMLPCSLFYTHDPCERRFLCMSVLFCSLIPSTLELALIAFALSHVTSPHTHKSSLAIAATFCTIAFGRDTARCTLNGQANGGFWRLLLIRRELNSFNFPTFIYY